MTTKCKGRILGNVAGIHARPRRYRPFMRVGGSLPNPPPSGSHHPSYMSPCPSDVFNYQACLCCFVPHQSLQHPSKSFNLPSPRSRAPPQFNPNATWRQCFSRLTQANGSQARTTLITWALELSDFCLHSWGLRGVSLRQGPLPPAPCTLPLVSDACDVWYRWKAPPACLV
ncbi:hypothetical protein LZ32DRAFT_163611 [Colletotrichum eremochloae]|nr:hypothetical protein LZ32DRAFT_163611 [Colletotrichum eremochloae]